MIRRVKSALAVTVVTFALFGTPAFADIDSPAWPELPAPRTDQPDFQQDDESEGVLTPPSEGADPRPLTVGPDIVIVDPPIID